VKEILDTVVCEDTLSVLKTFPDEYMDCIITSPPYWGLRDYGEETAMIWDGDAECEHEWQASIKIGSRHKSGETNPGKEAWYKNKDAISQSAGQFCSKCGAWYGQLGLEPTLELYLSHLLRITAELKRVLKPSGIMFWNHGDCYAVSEKCLCLQNYRLILRVVDEQNWILRNTIQWVKPNHMPSSAEDRFASSYEPVFMLVKNKKYWFDLNAVREAYAEPLNRWGGDRLKARGQSLWDEGTGQDTYRDRDMRPNKDGKNPGDVWTIPTQPYPGSHFATFPEKLIEPMIKAGCPAEICKKCGEARKRISETSVGNDRRTKGEDKFSIANETSGFRENNLLAQRKTTGWTDCGCNAGFESGIVLDPFAGAGTTCVVAKKLGRHYIGIELNKSYCQMAERRIDKVARQTELGLSLETRKNKTEN